MTIATLSMNYTKGINFSIDFTGGTSIDVALEPGPSIEQLRNVLNKHTDILVYQSGQTNEFTIGVKNTKESKELVETIKNTLQKNFSNCTYNKIDFVGAQFSQELVKHGLYAVIISLIGMFIYLYARFNWQYGVGGIVALIHDVIGTILLFVITQMEFSMASVAALLTTIGYSINDSVVIFDKVRENVIKYRNKTTLDIVNISINATLSRTTLTSITTLLAALPMIILGHGELQNFSIVVFFGVLIGTYSSLFIASPLLLITGLRHVSNVKTVT